MEKILVVEDKAALATMLRETLESEGYEVFTAQNGAEGIRQLKEVKPDLVLTDLKLPKKNGLDVLKASKSDNLLAPVIVMTAYGTVEVAVNAMKLGAFDFITKPLDTDYLVLLIDRALSNRRLVAENILLKDAFSSRMGVPEIIGTCPAMQEVARRIQKVASAKTTVLLQGESGTGKELFARAIHDLSPRRNRSFVPINCAAIPSNLLESELFGHEKGAFTGAAERKPGRLELADRGTVFLDEIGEMEGTLQSKLLRVLQEGEIERVGGTVSIKLDLRVIAASNRNLEQAVKDETFREDLFYRLSVFPVLIPPLRQRKEDIPILLEHMISRYATEMNVPLRTVSPAVIERMKQYPWKGNVRELENVIERAMILCEGDEIALSDIALNDENSAGETLAGVVMGGTLEETAKSALRIAESRRIRDALDETGGNKSRAAELLKVSYKTLLTKIKDYQIDR